MRIINNINNLKQEKNDCITIISKNREIKRLHLINEQRDEQTNKSFFSKYFNGIPSFFNINDYNEKNLTLRKVR